MPQIHPGFRPDYFYGGSPDLDSVSTTRVVSDRICFTLLFCPIVTVFNRIGIEITSSNNSECRLGIYSNNDDEAVPNKLILDAGVVSCQSNGIKEIEINIELIPGWYWLAALWENTPTVRAIVNGEFDDFMMGSPSVSVNGYYLYYDYSFSNGDLPLTIPEVSNHNARIPFIHLRRATY